MALHTLLKKLRLAYPEKLSQEKLAHAVGITRASYGKKEMGKMPISLEEITNLANFYNIDVTVFFNPDATINDVKYLKSSLKKHVTVPPKQSSAMNLKPINKGDEMPMPQERDPNRLILELSSLLVDKEREIKRLKQELFELRRCKECESRQHCDRNRLI